MILEGKEVPVTAYYLEEMRYPVILGYNFLKEHKIVINFEDLSLKINNQSQVKAVSSTVLPPNSETTMCGYIVESSESGTALVTNSLEMVQKGVFVANALVTVTQGFNVIPMKVLNIEDHSIDLPEHYVIGKLETVGEDIDVQPYIGSESSICNLRQETTESTSRRSPKRQDAVTTNNHERPPDDFTAMFDTEKSSLNKEEKEELMKLLWEYEDIFARKGRKLGCTDVLKFKIKLRPDAKPLKARPYRSNPKVRKEISKQIKEMLDNDIIRPSTSNYTSPVLLVSKADGGVRFVTDFRKANAQNIVPESATLPRIDCSLESIGSSGAKYFSTLDLQQGYWQIEVDEDSKQYTAFVTHDGVWEYNRMPFGLANSPSCFMRMIGRVMMGLTWEICLCYLDDIIIFSSTVAEHFSRLRKVFDRIRAANLTLKPTKCCFGKKEIKFLGHLITENGVSPLPDKIQTIMEVQQPKTVKQVRAFLGLVGYYRKFIKGFSQVASPLNELTKKDAVFKWSQECEEAFQHLRNALINPPILAYPNYNSPYILETDASHTGVGMVLSQEQEGKQRVIAYAGKKLNDAQRNYSTTEKEALAVVCGLQQFESFLVGNKITIITDHIALKWLLTQKAPTGRLAQQSPQQQSMVTR